MPKLECISHSACLQLFGASKDLVKWSQNRCEMAGTNIGLASRHSLAYIELWSLYPSRQDSLKALESDVVRFLACHLSSTAPSWHLAAENGTLEPNAPGSHAPLG